MSSFLARTRAVALVGLDGTIVDVETHVGRGLVTFTLVGLPDASLREARDRVRSALQACELEVLDRHVTVGLSPAGLQAEGARARRRDESRNAILARKVWCWIDEGASHA